MAKFEDFPIYKKVLEHTKNIYSLINKSDFKTEFEFKNQIKRAVLSISNNIAEGSEYQSNKQFVRFLIYAKGSCAEVLKFGIWSISVLSWALFLKTRKIY